MYNIKRFYIVPIILFMYLEKLEIQGFKSFANKNKLVFSGILENQRRGITVVVGPNGSGKSNIADSIRWVLGEQSTKLLRSKKSEDVIFSGSDKKSRLNMSEVSLFLNNESNDFLKNRKENKIEGEELLEGNRESDSIDALLMLPEIVLTRRVFRDGNSEYLINNNKVRLSDIQIFLAKANFGQKTYSVIGQGMVENFLNTSPAERKAFFDEATGVKQYQIKRDISLNKLENSQENLAKVEMLLNEIEPRLKSLTRQVGKLKKRQFLEEELLANQLEYYSRLWRDIETRSTSFNEQINNLQEEKNKIEISLEQNKGVLEQLNQGETIGEEFYELQKRFLFLQTEKSRLEKQVERMDLWTTLNKKNNNSDNGALTNLHQEKEELQKIINDSSENIEKFKNDFSKIEELEKVEKELFEVERDLSEKNKELSKIEAWMEVKLEKQGKFDLSFLISRQASLKNDGSKIKEDIESLTASIESKIDKINKNKEIINEITISINEAERELSRINTEESPSNVKKINSDLKVLSSKIELINDYSDGANISKIIKEIKDAISDLLKFSSGDNYNYKIESVNTKLVELKNEKNKLDSSVYNLQIEYNSEKNKKENLERDLIKIERELLDINEKIKINEKEDNSDDGQAKKEELEKAIGVLNEKNKELRDKKNTLRLEKEDWQSEKSRQQDILQKTQNKLNEINNQIGLVKNDSFKIQSKLEDLMEDIKNNVSSPSENISKPDFFEIEATFIKNLSTNIEKELAILQAKIDNFNQEQENKKRSMIELQKKVNDLENDLNRVNNNLNNNKIELTREETRIEDLSNNILNDQLEIEKIKSYKTDKEINVSFVREEIVKLKSQLELIGGIDPETEKEYEETQKRYDFLFEQTEDLNKTIKSLEKVILELDTVIKDRFDIEFKVISEKFNEYFKILFNGGNAKIFALKEETSPEEEKNSSSENNNDDKNIDIRNSQSSKNIKIIRHLKKHNAIGFSGVDISATPPGKKISSVNMLSGGERALTAIALICAIISSNPAPFVVLDEVDAALDEANSERLAKILDDLSNKTQFIAISHNRATMKRANILYGVTMQSDGVSKLLSVKLDENII